MSTPRPHQAPPSAATRFLQGVDRPPAPTSLLQVCRPSPSPPSRSPRTPTRLLRVCRPHPSAPPHGHCPPQQIPTLGVLLESPRKSTSSSWGSTGHTDRWCCRSGRAGVGTCTTSNPSCTSGSDYSSTRSKRKNYYSLQPLNSPESEAPGRPHQPPAPEPLDSQGHHSSQKQTTRDRVDFSLHSRGDKRTTSSRDGSGERP